VRQSSTGPLTLQPIADPHLDVPVAESVSTSRARRLSLSSCSGLRPVVTPRVRSVSSGTISLTGIGQTVAVRQPRHTTRSYYVRVQNDGQAADRLAIIGPAGKPGLVVRYFAGGRDVTPSVINGSYVTGMLAPGAATVLRLVVSATADARVGSVTSWPLTVTSRANALSHDVVTTRITVAAD